QHSEHLCQMGLVHVEHQADAALRIDCAAKHQRDIFNLLALFRRLPCFLIGDELRLRFAYGFDNAQAIGSKRASRFGYLDDGIGQNGRLHLCCAPGELDFYRDVLRSEVVLCSVDQLCSDDAIAQVFRLLKTGILRHGQNPAHLPAALFGIDKIGDSLDNESAFNYPITASQSGIEKPVLDVARHLLRSDQHAFNLRVVDAGEIRATTSVDVETRASEEGDGRVLQAAFGNAEANLHRFTSSAGLTSMFFV